MTLKKVHIIISMFTDGKTSLIATDSNKHLEQLKKNKNESNWNGFLFVVASYCFTSMYYCLYIFSL